MADCPCCMRPADGEELWHPRCLRRLFGSTRVPAIPFGVADLPSEILKTGARMSISGAQIKASVRLDGGGKRLEVVASGGTHVLKPEPQLFPELPANENLCMCMAAEVGLPVPLHGLFPMADGGLCYVVRRFDRVDGERLRNETMFQVLGATEKYAGSLERVGKAIRAHAGNVGLEAMDFFERTLFCFLTGNGDMHLKNWALLGAGKRIGLAPCYDLVCSKAYLPDEADSALTLNGKKDKIGAEDFLALAASLRLDRRAASNALEKFRRAEPVLREMCRRSALSEGLRRGVEEIVRSRCGRIFGK